MSLFPIVDGRARFDASGNVDSDRYSAGIRYTQEGAARSQTSAGTDFNQGIPMSSTGQVALVDATAGLPADVVWLSGLPISGNRVCISNKPVSVVSSGIPYDSAGAVAATVAPITNLPTLDLVFAGTATDPLDAATTADDTLALNFVAQAYQIAAQYAVWGTGGLQAVNFADIVTFTRESTGTYFNSAGTLTSAANNVPRFDYDPSTLTALGLLIEDQKTNNLVRSESFRGQTLTVTITGGTFQNGETVTATGGGAGIYVASESTATSFVLYNCTGATTSFTGTLTGGTSGATATISGNATAWSMGANAGILLPPKSQVAPDQTTTAEVFGPTTVGTLSRTMFQEFTTTTQGAWTFSLFVKKGTLTNNLVALRVRENTGTHAFRANFNLSTLAVPTISIDGGSWIAGIATVTPCQNNWVRISVSGTVNTAVTFYRTEIWLGGYQSVADTIGTIYVWGAQLEAGAFPTSYIPTTTIALTRSVDEVSVNTLAPWYNSYEGTLYSEAQSYSSTSYYITSASIDNNTLTNRIQLRRAGSLSNVRMDAGGATALADLSSGTATGINKQAATFKPGDQRAANNGTLFTGITPIANMPTVTTMRLGGTTGPSSPWNGWIRRISYYPRIFSNADLQTITT